MLYDFLRLTLTLLACARLVFWIPDNPLTFDHTLTLTAGMGLCGPQSGKLFWSHAGLMPHFSNLCLIPLTNAQVIQGHGLKQTFLFYV